jgi:hypothetical protein
MGRVSEVSQVGVSVTVELQRMGEGIHHLRRWMLVTALFEPHEVIGADPSEVGNFISAESWHATVAVVLQTRLRRPEQVAPRA